MVLPYHLMKIQTLGLVLFATMLAQTPAPGPREMPARTIPVPNTVSPQIQKLIAESRAGHMVADVVESTGLEVPMRAANIDQPFWSPQTAAYPENLRDPQNYWAPTRVSYLGACYNTNLVKPADLPKSFQVFLDP